MKPNTRLIKAFIGGMAFAAMAGAAYTGRASHTLHPGNVLALLALAAATSRMKIKLPALEAIAIACISTVLQCWPQAKAKFKPEQMLFNASMMAFATSTANLIWNAGWLHKGAPASGSLMLASTTAAFFLGQTAPVAGIIRLAEGAAYGCASYNSHSPTML